MPTLREIVDMVVKRISALTREATSSDLTDGEFLAVDKTDGYTRKMTVANFASWVLGRIRGLSTSIIAFRTGDVIPVDGPNGTAKMSKDNLLKETAQNALAVGVTPSFNFLVTSKTANIFDGSLKSTRGYYDASGVFHSASGYYCTAPIFIKCGVKYKYPFQASQFSSNTKVFITNIDGEVLGNITGVVEGEYNTFTAENYCYVVLNIGTSTNLANFMLCEYDQWPAEYVKGYGYDLNVKVGVSDENLRDVIDPLHLPSEVFENGQVIDNGVNLFNKDAIKSNYYIDHNGAYVSSSGYFVSNPIKVMRGKQYSFYVDQSYFYGNKFFAYVSESDLETITKVARYTESSNIAMFTAEETGYIRFSGHGSTASVMFSEGEYPSDYVAFHGRQLLSDIMVPAGLISDKVNYKNLPSEVFENGQVIDNGVNLFNQSSLGIKSGYYINTSGAYASGYGYWVSHPIFVAKGFSYSFNVNQSGFGFNKVLAYVSESDLETITDVINYVETSNIASFTAPKDGHIRFSGVGSKSEIMFAFAALFPEEYVAYHPRQLMDDIALSEGQRQQITSKLAGKILSCVGDSICYGDGFAGGYCKIIGDTFGMTYENLGQNGAHVSEWGGHTPYILNKIQDIRADADYVIVEGGVNDHGNTSIGSLSSGYVGPFDKTTLYGAFEQIWHDCYARFPGKKIGYIAVHKVASFYDSQNTGTDNIYKIAIETCKKWGIPVCDLNDNCPPFAYFNQYSDLTSIYSGYTKNSDGWHPTEDGYKKYYVPKIVPWLESL